MRHSDGVGDARARLGRSLGRILRAFGRGR
jgi:hypothetical protein